MDNLAVLKFWYLQHIHIAPCFTHTNGTFKRHIHGIIHIMSSPGEIEIEIENNVEGVEDELNLIWNSSMSFFCLLVYALLLFFTFIRLYFTPDRKQVFYFKTLLLDRKPYLGCFKFFLMLIFSSSKFIHWRPFAAKFKMSNSLCPLWNFWALLLLSIGLVWVWWWSL